MLKKFNAAWSVKNENRSILAICWLFRGRNRDSYNTCIKIIYQRSNFKISDLIAYIKILWLVARNFISKRGVHL